MSFALTTGGAAARGRYPIFFGWYHQAIGIETTRVQAQSYLPEGFEPTVGAAGQEALVHFMVTTYVCGDSDAPELELATTYLGVRPPKEYRSSSRAVHYFLLDAAISGTNASRLRKDLCAHAIFAEGAIDSSQQMDTTDPSVSRGTSAVESPLLSFKLGLGASGAAVSGGGSIRWLYEADGRIRHFDSAQNTHYLSIGAGHVQFTELYLDLPPAAAGPAFYDLEDISFSPPAGCRN